MNKAVEIYDQGAWLLHGTRIIPDQNGRQVKRETGKVIGRDEGRQETISYQILQSHNVSDTPLALRLKADALVSDDLTWVGIIQTAKASGLECFPVPYVMSCCHNSLHAVGGTVNADDHVFGLSACKKYGGIFIPPHVAVMHQYMREEIAGCGKLILGSDSHTRYGALGTMAMGEGGGEIVRQLLDGTYDVPVPEVAAVYLTGKPQPGVGPQDIALAIIRAVYENGFVKNRVMEFVGPGISSMTADYRCSLDVMTTETACWSSVWQTDGETEAFLDLHGRKGEYRELKPGDIAYYDRWIAVDLGRIKPMIALPFHPSNAYEIDEFKKNAADILRETERRSKELCGGRGGGLRLLDKLTDRGLKVDQAVIAGCAGGTYTNIVEAAHILRQGNPNPAGIPMSVYPASQPVYLDLMDKGVLRQLLKSGVTVRSAFCGPCIGAGDIPGNQGLSIRHVTRNFPNREGAQPANGQAASVALMDARSIAATVANGGILMSAMEADCHYQVPKPCFEREVYERQVVSAFGTQQQEVPLIYGPNIRDWPELEPLKDKILLRVCSVIMDDVTTTDDLIPSGEVSSYRSDPFKLAEFTLSGRDPQYIERARATEQLKNQPGEQLEKLWKQICGIPGQAQTKPADLEIGSVIYAVRPGDGSAREQAASCQRVLGGLANICREYATKRYRTNLINWGLIPFQMKGDCCLKNGDYIYIPGVKRALGSFDTEIKAYILGDHARELHLYLAAMTETEAQILEAGGLINFNRSLARNACKNSGNRL